MRWSCASRERGALGGSDRVRNNFRPVTTSVDTLRYVQPSLFNIIIGHPRGGRYVTRYTVWWAQTQTNDTKQARAHSVDTCTYTVDHTNERASYTKVDTYGLRTGIHTRTAEGDSRIHGGWMQGGYTVDRRWIQAGWIHGRYLVDLPFCRGTTSRGIRAKRYIHHVSTVYPPCIDHVSTVYRTYLLTTYRVYGTVSPQARDDGDLGNPGVASQLTPNDGRGLAPPLLQRSATAARGPIHASYTNRSTAAVSEAEPAAPAPTGGQCHHASRRGPGSAPAGSDGSRRLQSARALRSLKCGCPLQPLGSVGGGTAVARACRRCSCTARLHGTRQPLSQLS